MAKVRPDDVVGQGYLGNLGLKKDLFMKNFFLGFMVLFLISAVEGEGGEHFKSVDELGPVVSRNGHLYYARRGDRARFIGASIFTNLPDDRLLDDRTALVMAKYGQNLMRFHCHGSFYAYQGQETVLKFNAKWLDDLDRMVAAARKYGIYFSLSVLDNLKSRADGDAFAEPFFPGDQLEEWKKADISGTGDPRYLAIYRKIVENFLNHVNPYTRLAYKDEPAFLYFQIFNESNFGYDLTVNSRNLPDNPYNRKWVNHFWGEFLKVKYGSPKAAVQAWKLPADSPSTIWFRTWRNEAEMQDIIEFGEWYDLKTYHDFKQQIDKQCKRDVPVMLAQLQTYPRNLYTQTKTNLGGFHVYFGFSAFLSKVEGVPLLQDEVLPFGSNGFEFDADRTFWGQNDNRIVSVPTTAAVSALHDLDGIAYFVSHWGWFAAVAKNPDPMRPSFEDSGVNCYAVISDPIHRAMLKVAANIFRRADLLPPPKRLIVRQTPERLCKLDQVPRTGENAYPPDWVFYDRPFLESKMFDYCISNRFVDEQPPIVENGPDQNLEPKQFWADFRSTGTLPGNYPKGWQFKIDTLRTQGF